MEFSDSQSRSASRSSWSYDYHKNFSQISPVIHTHIKQVYTTLCCSIIASVFGAYLHILCNIGDILTTLATFGCLYWLIALTPRYEESQPKRVSKLMAGCLLQGTFICALIKLTINPDPSILLSAFMGISVARAAMLGRRREYLYLGGILSFGFLILFWIHFDSSIFGASVGLPPFEFYFGLLVHVGSMVGFGRHMVVDSQEIIEKAHLGDLDYVKHSFLLFNDFTAAFVGIIVMLKRSDLQIEGRGIIEILREKFNERR